jgi:hypothetical protein
MKIPLLRPGMVLDMREYVAEKAERIRVEQLDADLTSEAAAQQERLQDKTFYWRGRNIIQNYVEAHR